MDRDDMTSDERMRFDQNGWRNERGRSIFDDDEFIVSSDDSLGALEEAGLLNDEKEKEMKTPDFPSYNGPRKPAKSRRKKKGFYPKKSRGRPLIGAEVRVKLHTSIARCTQDMLGECGVPLAKVLTASARGLMADGW